MSPAVADTTQTSSTPTRSKRPAIIAAIVIIVIAVAAVVIWKLSSGGSSNPSTTAPKQARALYSAWQNGNRDRAGKVATAPAVNALFRVNADEWKGLKLGGCRKTTKNQFPKVCTFSRPGGSLLMTVNKVSGKITVTAVLPGPAALPPTTTTT
jgi:hypothetical protein